MRLNMDRGDYLRVTPGLGVEITIQRSPNVSELSVEVLNGNAKDGFRATYTRVGMQVESYPGTLSGAEQEALWEGPDGPEAVEEGDGEKSR